MGDSRLIDGYDDIIVTEDVHVRSPTLHGFVIDSSLTLVGCGQTLIEEGIEDIDLARSLGLRLPKVVLEVPSRN